MSKILRFLRCEDGPTIVEYAVLLALIMGSMVAAVTYVGSQTKGMSDETVDALDGSLND